MVSSKSFTKIFLLFLVLFLVSNSVADTKFANRADVARDRTDTICNSIMHSNVNSTTIEVPEAGQGIVTLNDEKVQEIDCSKLERYKFHRLKSSRDSGFGVIHAVGFAIFGLTSLITVYVARSGRFIGEYTKILFSPLLVFLALCTSAVIFDILNSVFSEVLFLFSVLGTLLTPVALPLYVWTKSDVENRRMDALVAFAVSLINLLVFTAFTSAGNL